MPFTRALPGTTARSAQSRVTTPTTARKDTRIIKASAKSPAEVCDDEAASGPSRFSDGTRVQIPVTLFITLAQVFDN
jgi:hypothetical protein